MTEVMGGRKAVIADLENLFESTPDDFRWNCYYNHANEPVHLVPFLFNRLGSPWLTQYWTRQICDRAYNDSVEGIVGNEDAGQMSAWYVLAAAGIHPGCPGEPEMEITSPVFSRIEFKLDPRYASGRSFTIVARDNSPENRYIQQARLNGKPYNRSRIDFGQIAQGGMLELQMGPTPCKTWGVESESPVTNDKP